MSKKKKVVAVAAILSAVIISFLGGQTFSKYVTEIKGSGSAEVAAWSFKVYGDNEQTQTVRLASTVNDQTLVNNKIAPGTKGSFVIKVDGRGSDVGIKYNFKLQNETQKPSNLLFTYSGITFRNLSELLEVAGGTIDANADENAKVKQEEIDAIKKHTLIDRRKMKRESELDGMLIMLCFIFDINYPATFEIIDKDEVVETIFKRFNFKDEETKEKIFSKNARKLLTL